jgi:thiol-disulfide isomerase/thioredoxin
MKAIMISEISDYGIDGDLGKEYQKYISSPDSPPVFIEALKQRAQIWLRLRAGNPAPDFEAITTAGDTVRLSDYFGKYLFLDVWASWCKPCIAEFPHSLVMMLDSRFKDFEFIFVNLDRNQELWKQGMKQFNIPDGTHLFMPDDFDGEIFVQYNRTSIPRYILIDPQGKIINARAPRPSQRDKIFETISDLAL